MLEKDSKHRYKELLLIPLIKIQFMVQKKDAEISYMTAQVVHQELQDIKNYLEDKTPSLLVQPKEEEFRLINL